MQHFCFIWHHGITITTILSFLICSFTSVPVLSPFHRQLNFIALRQLGVRLYAVVCIVVHFVKLKHLVSQFSKVLLQFQYKQSKKHFFFFEKKKNYKRRATKRTTITIQCNKLIRWMNEHLFRFLLSFGVSFPFLLYCAVKRNPKPIIIAVIIIRIFHKRREVKKRICTTFGCRTKRVCACARAIAHT